MVQRLSRRRLLAGAVSLSTAYRPALGVNAATLTPSAAASEVSRPYGGPSTPENNGLTIDRNGDVECSTALNKWLQNLVANGDHGELGSGTFKTGTALVIGGGKSIRLSGNGSQSTVISRIDDSFPGLHINLTGNPVAQSGWVEGIGVTGPTPHPLSGKAGFLMDNTRQFVLRDTDVHNTDIAYDWINNCTNFAGYNCHVSRFNSCNVGYYLRNGDASGSDFSFVNCILAPRLHAMTIAGDGGGYHFYHGEITTGSVSAVDDRGTVMLGWDYLTGKQRDGLGNVYFQGFDFEGWKGCYAIRSFGEVQSEFEMCSFTATVASPEEQALGILKATDMKNSIIAFQQCNANGAYRDNHLATISGGYRLGSDNLRQSNWYIPPSGCIANGVHVQNPLLDITV